MSGACLVTALLALPFVAVAAPDLTPDGKLIDSLFTYLNMTGTRSQTFRPLTQKERNRLILKQFRNPLWYVTGAISAAESQWLDNPEGWEQGMSGYGKRYADIMSQYAIRKTVMFGMESLLHEDNRYFAS